MPDGRPLHRYRLDAVEHDALREHILHRARWGLAEAGDETAALFVLWAAHWFQREYRGGIRRWEDIGEALGVALDGSTARQLTRQGLKAWSRPARRSEGALNQWLMTLAVEGGFPAGVLEQADAWAGRYLARVVGALLAMDPLDEEVALAAAQAQEDHAPRAYRQEIFFALAADLGMTVVRLRREVEADERARGVPASAWLDATRPGWRDDLPVRAGSSAVARLVDGLLIAEPIQLASDGKIGCDRVLRLQDGAWRPALRLGLDGLAHGGICQVLAGRKERLRVYPTGSFARHAAGELAVFEPPGEEEDGWRVRPSRRDALVASVPFSVPVAIELRVDGLFVEKASWPGGEAVRGDFAVLAPDAGNDVLTLIGEGSGQYGPEPLVIVAPPTWTALAHGHGSVLDLLPDPTEDGRQLWRISGTAIVRSPDGDVYRIASGQSGTRRDRLLIGGPAPQGLESDEPGVEIFAGAPSVRVCEGQHVRSGRPGEIRWRADGERGWRSDPLGNGRVDIAWRDTETGYIRDRRRVVLLPAGARLACRREAGAAIYTPEGIAPEALASADAGLRLERRSGSVLARFSGRPSRRAMFTLTVGSGRPIRVSALFPLESGIARWSGTCVRGGPRPTTATHLSLSTLADCLAFGGGVRTLHAVLLDRDRRPLRGGTARWTFENELPLRGVAEDLAALLLPFADIDVVADLSFDDGAEHWRVSQFEAALIVRAGRLEATSDLLTDETLPFVGRAINDLTIEIVLGTSTPGDRLNRRPPALPDEVSGTWLVYLRRGDTVVARPSIVRFGAGRTAGTEGLAAAVLIPDKDARETAVLYRLGEAAAGGAGTHADMRWLAMLSASLNGLPPASLDTLRLLAHCPSAAARLALHAQDTERRAVLALADSLPFAWYLVNHTDWAQAAAAEEEALRVQIEGAVGAAARDLARTVVRNAAEKLVRLEPLLGWPLFAAGLVPPPSGQAHASDLMEAARDHIRRHGDQVSERGPCGSLFRTTGPGDLPPEFPNAFHPVHLETLDAPCAAACAAAGRERPSDDAVRRIKTAARTDPLYFAAAFAAQFGRLARSPHP